MTTRTRQAPTGSPGLRRSLQFSLRGLFALILAVALAAALVRAKVACFAEERKASRVLRHLAIRLPNTVKAGRKVA